VKLLSTLAMGTATAVLLALAAAPALAAPEIVAGPGADPECYKPWAADTKFFKYAAKPGPYRIALVNGFIANDWRVQMIKVAKAYAEQADVAKDIKEFKVISVGEDIVRQRDRRSHEHPGQRRPGRARPHGR
jgi:ribose transport system substrate-binding protein